MATLALAVAGAAAGGALMPAGLTVLGATISGAALGSQVGALAGSYVDHALFGASGQTRTVEGPRLSDLHITGSTEGAPIPRLYGRVRVGGQVIWADEIEERVVKTTSSAGGGKGAASPSENATENIEYKYYASFAVGLAEGRITGLGRVWADGREIDLSRYAYRLKLGTESQNPDSLIEDREGTGKAPAYRGLAYIVFPSLPLAEFGNRVPQFSFEIYRQVEEFGEEVKGIVLIPGSGEFAYATSQVASVSGAGVSSAENVHTRQGGTDWAVSLNQLERTLPNAKSVSLVVSWFGTDLRAGVCQIKPGVESAGKATTPVSWSVAGETRTTAYQVSLREGRPAYGGTPSDASVVEAIQDLKARGFSVTLTPFVLMDVPEGSTLPDPYEPSATQPPYPWRGRITVHPAPGVAGSPDKTAAAAAQIQSFTGTALPGHFSLSGTTVVYSGPDEWSYRRMVLHQAWLAKAAGGVSAFLIGTELRGLTWVRQSASVYPFVSALVQLAADVKSILGAGTKVLYAADWTEYFGHQPQDGTGDVYFHLDPLWASASIDAIGIDCYWPLSDWRDGMSHLDSLAGRRSTYDLAYLRSNVAGGEGFDWFYASAADRAAQVRTAITDGAGKPWVFRYKDLKSWWLNPHVNRPGGVESGAPTAWEPQSKPVWLMEVGCPAVDKGANQPNVFVDPKSSESAVPYFSRATRDDLIQRRYLRALIQAFDPASSGYVAGLNPVSAVYGGRMVDTGRIHVYCWDARPFPAFPYNTSVWSDGENWRLGHWLNGRFADAPLAETVELILKDYGFLDFEAGALQGTLSGYVIDRVMAPRDALQPLELAYFFDSLESGGRIVFRPRGGEPAVADFSDDDLVEDRPGEALAVLTRGQETELPASAKITYLRSSGDYRQAVAEARRLAGASGRIAQAELPIVLEPHRAEGIALSWLFEAWASRERASFTVPPSMIALEPGDLVTLDSGGVSRLVRITGVSEHGAREIEGRLADPEIYGGAPEVSRSGLGGGEVLAGQPAVVFLDLPLLRGDEPETAGYVAAYQSPWPGGVAIYGSPETTGYVLKAVAAAPAVMGTTLDPLPGGPVGRLDRAARVRVSLSSGELQSISRLQMLAGQNAASIRNAGGGWEVLQFETATLTGSRTYELSGLLRGQGGSEIELASAVGAGAPFVLLGTGIAPADVTAAELRLPLNWRYGPATRSIGDPTYGAAVHAFQGVGMRPLAPVHAKGVRNSGGDLTLSWIRRTRRGGDNWETLEVPLSEERERYEVDVLSGSTVVRTLEAHSPQVIYTAAQQIADFGAVQSSVDVKICQIGAVYGRGAAKSASL